MRSSIKFLGLVIFAWVASSLSIAGMAKAQASIPEILHNGCKKELKTYCSKVTPGEGRVVACLYSFGDKLSNDCAFAMFDAYDQFEHAMAALRHIARKSACRSDIAEYCKGVPPGGGRIYSCVHKHKATLTDGCRAALPKAEDLLRRAGIIR